MRSPRFSLRVSLASALIGAVFLSSLLLGLVTYGTWRQSLRDDLRNHLSQMAQAAALEIDPAVHAGLVKADDMQGAAYQALRAKLQSLRAVSPEIHYLYTFRWTPGEPGPRFVLDSGTPGVDFSPLGEAYKTMTPTLRSAFQAPYGVKVESDFYTDEYGTFLSAFVPLVTKEGTLEGVLGLDMDAGRIQGLEARLLLLVGGLTVSITVVMALLSWWFSRRISRPLLALSRDMGRIQEFHLDGVVHVDTRIREILTMRDSLESMKKGLRSFKKFVPADLVADLIHLKQEAVLGTEKAEVTVFFCDLENFTNAAENLSNDQLNTMLSDYFDLVTQVLQHNGATVDKFIGDAVMAFWNAPRPVENHPARAVRACLDVSRGLEILAEHWADLGLPALTTRIGLNSGPVLVGNVGHEERLSYTVLGDTVNLASRLESLNKYYGTKILAGQQTLLALPEGEAVWRPVDRVAVKGKSQGTLIGELASVEPSWWEGYRRAWERYSTGDFAAALDLFLAVQTDTGAPDGVSQVLAARCRRFVTKGVPEDWTGVWIMQDK